MEHEKGNSFHITATSFDHMCKIHVRVNHCYAQRQPFNRVYIDVVLCTCTGPYYYTTTISGANQSHCSDYHWPATNRLAIEWD